MSNQASSESLPAIGFEEEYQLVDCENGQLIPNCKAVMGRLFGDASNDDATNRDSNGSDSAGGDSHGGNFHGEDSTEAGFGGDAKQLDGEIQHELHLNQIEMASPICQTLDEVRSYAVSVRTRLAEAAAAVNTSLASAGTNPRAVPHEDNLAPKDRYRNMTERFQQIARDLYIFGCHVHVSMPDRELGVGVMNRCRRWLPLLQSMTANSPYWDTADTGYDSFRRELWVQWPMAGPPVHFAGLADHDAAVQRLVDAGAIPDTSHVYWDIRLPDKVPTIEFRAADAMTEVWETVGYAALVRAMVMAATADVHAGRSTPDAGSAVDPAVLRYAMWHAARYGMSDETVDCHAGKCVSTESMIDELKSWVAAPLERTGDGDAVDQFINRIHRHGNGARRQRRVIGDPDNHDRFPSDTQLRDVVLDCVARTKQVD